MQIQIDSREHENERKRIEAQFDAMGVSHFRSKLYVGDYMNLDNPRLVVDRKKDIQELIGNVCQQHERFQAEMQRAKDAGIKLVFLCEHGQGVTRMEDLFFWDNPRLSIYTMKCLGDGSRMRVQKFPKAMTGKKIYRTLLTMEQKYGVEFLFCDKTNTGARIVELLEGGQRGRMD